MCNVVLELELLHSRSVELYEYDRALALYQDVHKHKHEGSAIDKAKRDADAVVTPLSLFVECRRNNTNTWLFGCGCSKFQPNQERERKPNRLATCGIPRHATGTMRIHTGVRAKEHAVYYRTCLKLPLNCQRE